MHNIILGFVIAAASVVPINLFSRQVATKPHSGGLLMTASKTIPAVGRRSVLLEGDVALVFGTADLRFAEAAAFDGVAGPRGPDNGLSVSLTT